MADIFNEIDEDLRRDRLQKLWDRYSTVILAVAFLIVAGVAGWRGYQYWRAEQAKEMGDGYYSAAKLSAEGDHKGAEEVFRKLADNGAGGYPVLAGLRAAGEQALAGDAAGAIKSYEALVSNSSTPRTLADLALLRAAYLALDTEERGSVEARVAPLDKAGNPWRHGAREVQALAAWKAGDVEATRKRIDALLNDAEVPREFSARAEILTGLIRAAAGAKPAAAPSP